MSPGARGCLSTLLHPSPFLSFLPPSLSSHLRIRASSQCASTEADTPRSRGLRNVVPSFSSSMPHSVGLSTLALSARVLQGRPVSPHVAPLSLEASHSRGWRALLMSLPAAWVLCVVVCIRVPWMWFSWVLAPGSRGRSSERVWRVEVDLGYHDKRGLKGLVDRRTTSPGTHKQQTTQVREEGFDQIQLYWLQTHLEDVILYNIYTQLKSEVYIHLG